jgi:hypothetical protein
MSNQRSSSARVDEPGKLIAQRRLADSWLAGEHDQAGVTHCRPLE